jgi:protein-S-isoprenylcysteine O-methyltransferase Ste14
MTWSHPVSPFQFGVFCALLVIFAIGLARSFATRGQGTHGKRDYRSRVGALFQLAGVSIVVLGPIYASLEATDSAALTGILVAIVFGVATLALYRTSAQALATRRALVQHGPYRRVRHPIYFAMLCLMIALAAASGHWLQFFFAVPIFIAGTAIRVHFEDLSLARRFGDEFKSYARRTPPLVPRLR